MTKLAWMRHSRKATFITALLALSLVTAGVAIGAPSTVTFTPQKADQITNIDVLRIQIERYYGDPGKTGVFGANSNYAKEASSVAAAGARWLKAQAKKSSGMPAIVLDVDDTTLTTWNYEIHSNWAYNPTDNATYVLGQWFPATPGMVDMVNKAAAEGYAIFFITGRPLAQRDATLGNLGGDDGLPAPDVDAGYVTPTTIDRTGAGDIGPGLFTKPPKGSYPEYLNKPEFCADAIAQNASCGTIAYKSGTRAYIESLGYDIVASFGDQPSDLIGGYSDRTFKMPNPNYYLP
jgi:hypothetical protein